MAKTSCTPHTFPAELVNHIQRYLSDRYKHHLADPFTRFNRIGRVPAIMYADPDFTLIIRIDDTDRVGQHDTMLDSQTRARHDQCHETGVMDADGNTAGYENGLLRLHGLRLSQASPQVHGS